MSDCKKIKQFLIAKGITDAKSCKNYLRKNHPDKW